MLTFVLRFFSLGLLLAAVILATLQLAVSAVSAHFSLQA